MLVERGQRGRERVGVGKGPGAGAGAGRRFVRRRRLGGRVGEEVVGEMEEESKERLRLRLGRFTGVNGVGGGSVTLGAKVVGRFAVLPKIKGDSRFRKRSIGDDVAVMWLWLPWFSC